MTEKKGIDFLQVVCVAVGVFIGFILFRVVLDFSPIIGGALGGGIGAALGMTIYTVINRKKD